jgi:hypothetical protein
LTGRFSLNFSDFSSTPTVRGIPAIELGSGWMPRQEWVDFRESEKGLRFWEFKTIIRPN